jgi:predicted nucleotidyltransferase
MTNLKSQQRFEELLEQAKNDPKILGFFLTGSRGKGFENENSDYDLWILVEDDESKSRLSMMEFENFDICVDIISEFEKYAAWGSNEAWDRYDFSHIEVLVDKTGTIQKLVDEKGSLPKENKDDFIRSSLDAYINSVFRSVKYHRKQEFKAAQLEAAAGISSLLNVVFGLHDRIITPFFGYLEKELHKFPLEKLSMNSGQFTENIATILSTADLSTQQETLKMVEKLARAEGYGKVFDEWEGKDKWAMNYKAS